MNISLEKYFDLLDDAPELFVNGEELAIITSISQIEAFMKQSGIDIGVRYESQFIRLVVDLVQDKWGRMFAYERILPIHPGAIVALVFHQGKIVLLHQFRHAFREKQYAFLRGFGEKGLSSEENCKKEVFEELGAKAKDIQYLGSICPDSGLSSTRAKVFVCAVDDLSIRSGYEGIETVRLVEIDEFEQMCCTGEIQDAFTLATYMLWKTGANKI